MCDKSCPSERSPTPPSETVKKTLALLELFKFRPRMTASQIAHAAELPLSTAFRLINTLTQLHFVDYDEPTKTYRLGLKLLELGHLVSQQLDLPNLSMPFLSELARKAGETAHLSIRDHDEGVFIAKVEAEHSVRIHTPIGRRVPLHAGASMKLLLASMPDEEIRDYLGRPNLRAMADRTVVKPELLWSEIAMIRKQGYAVSRSEQTQGAAGVSAPVIDHTGKVIAGLTISGPEQRFTPEKIEEFIALATDTAEQLSTKLGFVRNKLQL